MSYILLREAYIANTRNDTSGNPPDVLTSCATASFKFTHKEISDPPHTHTHTHTHEHLC